MDIPVSKQRAKHAIGMGDQAHAAEPTPISETLYGGPVEQKQEKPQHTVLNKDLAHKRAKYAAALAKRRDDISSVNPQYQPNASKPIVGAYAAPRTSEPAFTRATTSSGQSESAKIGRTTDLDRFDSKTRAEALPTLKSASVNIEVLIYSPP